MEFFSIKITARVPARPPWYLVSLIFFDPICAICDKGPISMFGAAIMLFKDLYLVQPCHTLDFPKFPHS
jgi:hypothetical protein